MVCLRMKLLLYTCMTVDNVKLKNIAFTVNKDFYDGNFLTLEQVIQTHI